MNNFFSITINTYNHEDWIENCLLSCLNQDYENFEVRSPINPWLVQQPAGTPYGASFDKVKCLEINVQSGQILYIPAYWWYSLTFAATTSVCTFKYRTPMNTLAISPQLFLHILQTQNVQRKSVKKHVEKAVVVELSPATIATELDNKLLPLTIVILFLVYFL